MVALAYGNSLTLIHENTELHGLVDVVILPQNNLRLDFFFVEELELLTSNHGSFDDVKHVIRTRALEPMHNPVGVLGRFPVNLHKDPV